MNLEGAADTRSRLAEILDRDETATTTQQRWWQRPRPLVTLALACVLITTVVASRAFGSSAGSFRSVVVTTRAVDSTLTDVATIEPVNQAAIAFPVSGTVATVDVKVGDQVTVGRPLASLDREALEQSLHEKVSALTQAELALERALNDETMSGPGGTSGGPSVTGVSTLGSTSGIQVKLASIATTSTDPDIAAARQAVLDAQQVVDDKLAVAGTAVTSASTVCAAMGAPPTTDEINACQAAISDTLAAQQEVQTAQDVLVGACDALDALLQDKANQPPTTTQPNTPSTGSAPGGTQSGAGGTSTSPSSADLVAYQRAIDSARLIVAVAQQALNQATIASPIDGVVVAVNVKPGLAVDAASQTQTIVVQGEGGHEATMLVSVQRVSDVRVGQRAIVIPDRSGRELEGEVAYISTVPDADSTSSSYLVVIGLNKSAAGDLRNGETATATIVLEQASQALAIPTSALTTQGSRHIVQVLRGGEVQNVSVDVGVIGATWTEITSGLHDGQEVVVADLDEPLPDSATSSDGGNGALYEGGPVVKG